MHSSSRLQQSSFGSRGYSTKDHSHLHRKRPNKTQLDSQQLFQQSLKLNHELTNLIQQNKQIKLNLNKVDNIRNYKQGLIYSVQNIIKQKSKDINYDNSDKYKYNDRCRDKDKSVKISSWLVYNLKKKINDVKKQIEIRQKQIEQFNCCKIALILKQKQVQAQQLKKFVQKQFQIRQGRNKQTLEIENNILDQLVEMRLYQQLQYQYIQELNSNILVENQNLKKILEDISSHKKQLDLRRQEYEIKKKTEEASKMEFEMERICIENEDKRGSQEVGEMEIIREIQGDQIKQLELKIDNIIQRQNAEKKRLQAKIEELKEKIKQKENKQNSEKEANKISSSSNEVHQSEEKQHEQSSKFLRRPQKLVSALKLKNVQPIGEFLRFNLSIKKLTHNDWKPLIVSNEEQSTISIQQLIDILSRQPFNLKQEQPVLLARYLVQQAVGKYIFDETLRQDIPIVKSIIEKVISPLISYSQQQQITLSQHIGQITQKYNILLIGALETKANKKDYISKSEVGPVFEACSMEFNEKQVEYIVFYMFGHSESLNQLKYRNINKIGIDLLNYKN